MEKVYLVQHVSDVNGEYEDVKLIGIFSSKATAEQAIKGLKTKPGFEDAKNGFSIDEIELDHVEWSEGYFIIDHGEPRPRS